MPPAKPGTPATVSRKIALKSGESCFLAGFLCTGNTTTKQNIYLLKKLKNAYLCIFLLKLQQTTGTGTRKAVQMTCKKN
jgi:hypothetical protein